LRSAGRRSSRARLSYSKADSDFEASQADIEHGAYSAFNATGFIAPTAPGCNNGTTCTNGNHGYTFNEKQHTDLQFSNLPFTYDDAGSRYFLGVKAKL